MFYNISIDLNKSGELKIDKKPEDSTSSTQVWVLIF